MFPGKITLRFLPLEEQVATTRCIVRECSFSVISENSPVLRDHITNARRRNPGQTVFEVLINSGSAYHEYVDTLLAIWRHFAVAGREHRIRSPLVSIETAKPLYLLAKTMCSDTAIDFLSTAIRSFLGPNTIWDIMQICGHFDCIRDEVEHSATRFRIDSHFYELTASLIPWLTHCYPRFNYAGAQRLYKAIVEGNPGFVRKFTPLFIDGCNRVDVPMRRGEQYAARHRYDYRCFVTKCAECSNMSHGGKKRTQFRFPTLCVGAKKKCPVSLSDRLVSIHVVHEQSPDESTFAFFACESVAGKRTGIPLRASIKPFLLHKDTQMNHNTYRDFKADSPSVNITLGSMVNVGTIRAPPMEFMYNGKCSHCDRMDVPVFMILLCVSIMDPETDPALLDCISNAHTSQIRRTGQEMDWSSIASPTSGPTGSFPLPISS